MFHGEQNYKSDNNTNFCTVLLVSAIHRGYVPLLENSANSESANSRALFQWEKGDRFLAVPD